MITDSQSSFFLLTHWASMVQKWNQSLNVNVLHSGDSLFLFPLISVFIGLVLVKSLAKLRPISESIIFYEQMMLVLMESLISELESRWVLVHIRENQSETRRSFLSLCLITPHLSLPFSSPISVSLSLSILTFLFTFSLFLHILFSCLHPSFLPPFSSAVSPHFLFSPFSYLITCSFSFFQVSNPPSLHFHVISFYLLLSSLALPPLHSLSNSPVLIFLSLHHLSF